MSNFISIEAVLDDLLKSDESEKLDDDYKYEDEEEQEEKDEQEKDEPTDEVEKKEEDTKEEPEEKEQDEEQNEEQDEDKEEEPEPDEEDDSKEVMSVNEATDVLYDKLMPRILEAVKEMLDEDKEEDEDTTRVIRKAVEAISDIGGRLDLLEGNIEDLKKSEDTEKILELENKLDKAMSIKKSVGDMRVFNRFDESKELSKAEKAEILANEMEAGNRRVSINDVTNAELGYPLSQAAEEIIKKYR